MAQMNTDFSSGPLDYSSAELKRIPLSTRIETFVTFERFVFKEKIRVQLQSVGE